ncbi:MAG TPA: HupE/UreJ family protein [Candidatus Eisenbacteria bacterium]|nr:HupE/UreJ family protein [Candidatus Eisenbacteria bacterium]
MSRTLAVAVLSVALAGGASAHPLAPSLLEVRELGAGRVGVRWKVPVLGVPGARVVPELPEGCRDLGPRRSATDASAVEVAWTAECGEQGLVGARIAVGGLTPFSPPAVVRVVMADGRVAQALVTADQPFLVVPARSRPLDVAWGYARLGVEHILSGPDHLLFVLGLVLLTTTTWQLLGTVTAFTLGHSVTLTAAVLGLVALPVRPIEAAIAASVFLLAVEVARDPGSRSAIRRRPWVMAALFGLLHGFGFAAALTQAGLPQDEVPLALLAFNIGIEIGQAFFVVVVVALRALAGPLVARVPRWVTRVPVYAMGSLAAFWWMERTAALFR